MDNSQNEILTNQEIAQPKDFNFRAYLERERCTAMEVKVTVSDCLSILLILTRR